MSYQRTLAGLLCGVTLAGCAPDLAANHPWDDGEPTPPLPTGAPPPGDVLLRQEGTRWEATVDARDATRWVGLVLDGPREVDPELEAWDLRFQRFHISVNGGWSGDAGHEVVFVEGATLDDPPAPPTEGWLTDAGPEAEGGEPVYAFADWYDYDVGTHLLTPWEGVWLVRTGVGDVYALQILDYYDDTGSSAVLTLQGTIDPIAP